MQPVPKGSMDVSIRSDNQQETLEEWVSQLQAKETAVHRNEAIVCALLTARR